jgi:hypothetical protein
MRTIFPARIIVPFPVIEIVRIVILMIALVFEIEIVVDR